MSKIRRSTRSQLIYNLSRYLGGPAELLPSDVPKFRDVLRLVLNFQRYRAPNSYKLCTASLSRKAAHHVLCAWNNSSSLFSYPVIISKNAIASSIHRAYNFFAELNDSGGTTRHHVNRHHRSSKTSWVNELDRLCDITKCRWPIAKCT